MDLNMNIEYKNEYGEYSKINKNQRGNKRKGKIIK